MAQDATPSALSATNEAVRILVADHRPELDCRTHHNVLTNLHLGNCTFT